MSDERVSRLTLAVPDLPERPYVSTMWCAVLAEGLIAEEFASWSQVRKVEVDVPRGRVELEIRGEPPPLDSLIDALADLGYRAWLTEGSRPAATHPPACGRSDGSPPDA